MPQFASVSAAKRVFSSGVQIKVLAGFATFRGSQNPLINGGTPV